MDVKDEIIIKELQKDIQNNNGHIIKLYDGRNEIEKHNIKQDQKIETNRKDINNLGYKCENERQSIIKVFDRRCYDNLKKIEDLEKEIIEKDKLRSQKRKNIFNIIWSFAQPLILLILSTVVIWLLAKGGIK